jgi:hypothetical protein
VCYYAPKSGEEKASQVGNAAAEFQEARTELAHIDTKLEAVFSTYRDVLSTMDRTRGSIQLPQVVDGKLSLDYVSQRADLSNS